MVVDTILCKFFNYCICHWLCLFLWVFKRLTIIMEMNISNAAMSLCNIFWHSSYFLLNFVSLFMSKPSELSFQISISWYDLSSSPRMKNSPLDLCFRRVERRLNTLELDQQLANRIKRITWITQNLNINISCSSHHDACLERNSSLSSNMSISNSINLLNSIQTSFFNHDFCSFQNCLSRLENKSHWFVFRDSFSSVV